MATIRSPLIRHSAFGSKTIESAAHYDSLLEIIDQYLNILTDEITTDDCKKADNALATIKNTNNFELILKTWVLLLTKLSLLSPKDLRYSLVSLWNEDVLCHMGTAGLLLSFMWGYSIVKPNDSNEIVDFKNEIIFNYLKSTIVKLSVLSTMSINSLKLEQDNLSVLANQLKTNPFLSKHFTLPILDYTDNVYSLDTNMINIILQQLYNLIPILYLSENLPHENAIAMNCTELCQYHCTHILPQWCEEYMKQIGLSHHTDIRETPSGKQ